MTHVEMLQMALTFLDHISDWEGCCYNCQFCDLTGIRSACMHPYETIEKLKEVELTDDIREHIRFISNI